MRLGTGTKQHNGKNREYANMGLSCIFKYHNEKSGFATDLGLRNIFYLLHSLATVFCKSELGYENIPD